MENNMQRFQMPRVIWERIVESKMKWPFRNECVCTILMGKKRCLWLFVVIKKNAFVCCEILAGAFSWCSISNMAKLLLFPLPSYFTFMCIAYANNRHTNQLQCQRFHEKASNTVELIIKALESCGVLCALCVSDTQSWTSSNRHLADEFHSDHVSKLKLEMF